MNILEKIVAYKRPFVEQQKQAVPVEMLMQSIHFQRQTISLKTALTRLDNSSVIAEFKRRSPSKPEINLKADIKEVTRGYQNAGAAALSILTDKHFFGGHPQDILKVRDQIDIPILRKDFMFDPYQIYEAKSLGADAVLLIAEVLTKAQVAELSALAKDLGLDVLLETHTEDQLEKITEHIDIVGINNRNLKTFKVSIENSLALVQKLPLSIVKISESGIQSTEDIKILRQAGYQGFLIGELFMKTRQPAQTCKKFIEEINTKSK